MAGRNSVYGPSHAPVYDPPPIHGVRKVYMAGDTALPPFSVAGNVDGTGPSPGYPVRQGGTIHQCEVTVEDANESSADFDILVNGAVVTSHTADTAGLTTFVESIPLVLNDVVSAEITAITGAGVYNLLIVLRL